MEKCKLSLILTSISPETWPSIYEQIQVSMGEFSFELIACGPFFPTKDMENKGNFKFIRDFGNPSRCFQIAASIAEGKYITNIQDDVIVEKTAYSEAIKLIQTKTEKDGIIMLYSEGMGYSGTQHLTPSYFTAGAHEPMVVKHINPKWKTAPVFLYNLEYFKKMGGLDCRYEHVNINTHDFAFRLQNDGGQMFYSTGRVLAANWKPWGNPPTPVQLAAIENDLPLLKAMYDGDEDPINRKVDFDNWRNADAIWKRRFAV